MESYKITRKLPRHGPLYSRIIKTPKQKLEIKYINMTQFINIINQLITTNSMTIAMTMTI